jgi:hypothetical protein
MIMKQRFSQNNRHNDLFDQLSDPNVILRRLRGRVDGAQVLGEAWRIVIEAANRIEAPILDTERHSAIGSNMRGALVSGLGVAALGIVIGIAAFTVGLNALAGVVLSTLLAVGLAVAAALAVVAWQQRTDEALPARLEPAEVDAMARWLSDLGETGRPYITPWRRVGTFALLAVEALIVFLLSREAMFAAMLPVHAALACVGLALATACALIEGCAYLGIAVRKGSVRDLQAQLAESADPADNAKAKAMKEAYNACVGGHWFSGSRVAGHWLRCYKEAAVISGLLTVGFVGTVVLRLVAGLADVGELVALAVTAAIALATMIIATKRFADAVDLTEHVALARRIVRRFPNGQALRAHVARQENRVRGQVLEAQLALANACTPLKATQSALSEDLLAMLDAELARRAAAAGKAPATAEGVSSSSAAAGTNLPPRRPASGNGARGGDGPADHGADARAAGMPGAARRHRQNGTQPPPVRRAA